MKAQKFVVSEIKSEIDSIEHTIQSHGGVNAVRVDMQANTVTVDYDDARYNERDIKRFVTNAGLNIIDRINV